MDRLVLDADSAAHAALGWRGQLGAGRDGAAGRPHGDRLVAASSACQRTQVTDEADGDELR